MIRRPPRSTRTDTLWPYPTLFRSLAQLVAGSLDEVSADQVAGTPGTRVQHHPDGLALVQADLDEVVAAAERAQLLVHLVDPDLRVPGLDALQPLPQAGVGQGRLAAVGHLAVVSSRAVAHGDSPLESGRASCRESGCQYV